MGVKNVKPSDQTKKDTDSNTDTPAASAPTRDFSAPPPPMLRDSSKSQTTASAGTNPLDRIYKGSKQKELEEKQNHSLEGIDLREKLNYSKKHGYHPTQEDSYGEPPHHPSEEPSPLDRIYRAAKLRTLAAKQKE